MSSSESEEMEIFRGRNANALRRVKEESDYNEEDEEEEEEEEEESDYDKESEDSEEIYGAKRKGKKTKNVKNRKRKVSESSSDDDWRGSKTSSKNKKKKKKPVSGIVSDESDFDSSDDSENSDFGEFKKKRKEVPTGEIEFQPELSDPTSNLRIVDAIGDWNEEMDEFLIKWRGRSWHWAQWLPSNSEALQGAQRKLDNFRKKVEEEREESEEQGSVYLETLRFNLLENWRVVERVIAQHETLNEGTFYLCKWRALGYSECTWEWEGDIRGFSQDAWGKVDEFLTRRYGKRSITGNGNSKSKSSFQRYKEQPDYFPEDLKLRDYQLDGLNWLLYSWCRRVNVILADEMGLGKTIQSICFLTSLKVDYGGTGGPTLLVVPLSTIDAWQREFERWAGGHLNVIVYRGDAESRATARHYEFPGGCFDVLLTTYELVLKDEAMLAEVKWRLLLVDEGHRLKNAASQLYDVLFSLVPARGRVLITGTPLQNSLGELWCLLRFLMPDKFSDYADFVQKYSVDLEGEGEEQEDQNESQQHPRLAELHGLIKPHILRRLKRDVEHSLPGKREQIIRVDLTPLQKQLYRCILARNYGDLKRTQAAAGNRTAVGGLLNILGELKKICNHPLLLGTGSPGISEADTRENVFKPEESGKLVLLQRLLRRLKDGGHRVLIFSQSVRMLDLLQSFVRAEGYAWQRLDGSTTSVARHLAIGAFNASGSNDFVFLLSTRAGGLGINLATADVVIIYDSDWNPQNDLQAMARAHRIGQTKLVRIFRLVSAGTIEEEILERAKRKMVLDHLVIQQLKPSASGTSRDLQAILKFGAKALFDADTPAIAAGAVDLDAILAADGAVGDEKGSSGVRDEDEEFLGQFRMADLGALPNWDEIIPETDRIAAAEEQLRAEQFAKDVELQEALLTAATSRRTRTTESKPPVNAVTKVKKRAKTLQTTNQNDLVLFLWDSEDAVRAYEALSKFGVYSDNNEWEDKLMKRLEEILRGSGDSVPCHFRVIPGAPLQKASISGLLERLKGLKGLQATLQGYRSRAGDSDANLSGFRIALQGIKAPSNWPISGYSVQQDSALLVAVGRLGYGNWQAIRQDLSEQNNEFWMKLQCPQITRRVDYLLKELNSSKKEKEKPSVLDEMRVIEKFRRPFKPVRSSLVALESLKSESESASSTSSAHLLTDHLLLLGDFIAGQEQLRKDPEAWQFIGCFWPFQKGSTGPELRSLYESLKRQQAK